jgi:arachidonate 15-lipoxygenase
MLDSFEHRPGLVKIGCRVLFSEDKKRRSLLADRIDCALGQIKPTAPEWDRATKIALCAASTHLSLVRHFNWVHLAGGAQLAIATRNNLSHNHPLCRLLWPYTYGTQQSNEMVTRGQMVRGGDFENIFSFTFDGMCKLFDRTYPEYSNRVNDPEEDGRARGLLKVSYDTPTQQNLEALFQVMHSFVCSYLAIYYSRNANAGNDPETLAWLRELDTLVPNGIGLDPAKLHLGRAGAHAGGPAVFGDGAT